MFCKNCFRVSDNLMGFGGLLHGSHLEIAREIVRLYQIVQQGYRSQIGPCQSSGSDVKERVLA